MVEALSSDPLGDIEGCPVVGFEERHLSIGFAGQTISTAFEREQKELGEDWFVLFHLGIAGDIDASP